MVARSLPIALRGSASGLSMRPLCARGPERSGPCRMDSAPAHHGGSAVNLFHQSAQLGKLAEQRRRLKQLSALESDLAAFFKGAWLILEPESSLSWSWHYELLCEWLVLITSGQFRQAYPDK